MSKYKVPLDAVLYVINIARHNLLGFFYAY